MLLKAHPESRFCDDGFVIIIHAVVWFTVGIEADVDLYAAIRRSQHGRAYVQGTD